MRNSTIARILEACQYFSKLLVEGTIDEAGVIIEVNHYSTEDEFDLVDVFIKDAHGKLITTYEAYQLPAIRLGAITGSVHVSDAYLRLSGPICLEFDCRGWHFSVSSTDFSDLKKVHNFFKSADGQRTVIRVNKIPGSTQPQMINPGPEVTLQPDKAEVATAAFDRFMDALENRPEPSQRSEEDTKELVQHLEDVTNDMTSLIAMLEQGKDASGNDIEVEDLEQRRKEAEEAEAQAATEMAEVEEQKATEKTSTVKKYDPFDDPKLKQLAEAASNRAPAK